MTTTRTGPRAHLVELLAVHERSLAPGDAVRVARCVAPVLHDGPLLRWRDLLLRTLELDPTAGRQTHGDLAAVEASLGNYPEALRQVAVALGDGPVPDRIDASLRRIEAGAHAMLGQYDDARASYLRAIDGFRAHGMPLGETRALRGLAHVTWAEGRFDEASSLVDRCLAAWDRIDERRADGEVAFTRAWWGCARYLHTGDAEARGWVEEVHARSPALEPHPRAHAERYLAEIRAVDGALDEAEGLTRSFADRMGTLGWEHDAETVLARIALDRWDLDAAGRHAAAALTVRKADDRAAACAVAASIAQARGDLAAALAHADQAERLRVGARDDGHRLSRALLLVDLGRVAEAEGLLARSGGLRWCDRRLAALVEARLAQVRGEEAGALVAQALAPDERPWFGTRLALARVRAG